MSSNQRKTRMIFQHIFFIIATKTVLYVCLMFDLKRNTKHIKINWCEISISYSFRTYALHFFYDSLLYILGANSHRNKGSTFYKRIHIQILLRIFIHFSNVQRLLVRTETSQPWSELNALGKLFSKVFSGLRLISFEWTPGSIKNWFR